MRKNMEDLKAFLGGEDLCPTCAASLDCIKRKIAGGSFKVTICSDHAPRNAVEAKPEHQPTAVAPH
jgi:hypothetical protein